MVESVLIEARVREVRRGEPAGARLCAVDQKLSQSIEVSRREFFDLAFVVMVRAVLPMNRERVTPDLGQNLDRMGSDVDLAAAGVIERRDPGKQVQPPC